MAELLDSNPALDELRTTQRSRWESGDPVLLEALLPASPEISSNADTLLDLVYAEMLLREEFNERPMLADYQRRFPHLANALKRLFVVHDALVSLESSSDSPLLENTTGLDLDPLTAAPRLEGQTGPYFVEEEIGRGGMGIVYRAVHSVTGRSAALKVMRSVDASAQERTRFLTEATAVAALSHPNVVQIYEVCLPAPNQGTPFVALEYVGGGNLAEYLNGTPLPVQVAAQLLQKLADAVAHAHQCGILHRDLKPSNVMLGRPTTKGELTPKITDFGLARRLESSSGQTRTGDVLGTPSYMAPEQADGKPGEIGPSADIYSLGAILYETLTGRPPFKGATVLDTLALVKTQEPVSPARLNPTVPRDLEIICLKCLNKEPSRRYRSSRELSEDLTRFLNGETVKARPISQLERTWRWTRKRPASAILVSITGVAVMSLVAVWATFTVQLEERRKDAESQARIAQQERNQAIRQSNRAAHLLTLTAGALDDIAISARGPDVGSRPGSSGSVLFKLATFYARAARALGDDEALEMNDRQQLAEQYAVNAVRLLRCAEQVGYFGYGGEANRNALDTDPSFAALKQRPDFKTFRQRIPK